MKEIIQIFFDWCHKSQSINFQSIMIWRNVQMIAVINLKISVLNTFFFVEFIILA